ncbi:4-hydroxythreonine-4-phosphate dehydrogenase PdxA [Brevifollis gellanilyticus]|uniref:4-hydroxythreonine-4-phosphate dehydrogenase n=1 Tax=Brevifollis gellanilyticus TaxID=748831 RepID=A0A512MEW5_9BACT|nr:4-hydroxythreonine-4-phosphate dehydrogenase PdxA [Brevifollis gellanilyticus]GEP45273.1 4-hydroxythreonine-4-phosphate dehydrogenase [Brevifollis gellanilyticus]
MPKPLIAVTMGDPAGVGPEVCLQLLANEAVREIATPVIFGDARLLSRCARLTSLPAPKRIISEIEWAEKYSSIDEPAVLDIFGFDATDFTPGKVSAKTGAAGYRYVEKSIEAALAKQVAAVATAPLNKEALHAAGITYPGHTEMFAEKMASERSCMTFYSEEMICSLVTVHIGYQDVVPALTTQRILDVIELTVDSVKRVKGRAPKIAVCGLNPHAGENGLFGRNEEETIIAPAIAAARAKGIQIEGPLPPDTAFIATKRRTVDAYICMYHDQALIPLKALAFDTAVNTTLGLPVPRTSVDHGTACDIAWQGKANGTSLVEAVKLAAKMA